MLIADVSRAVQILVVTVIPKVEFDSVIEVFSSKYQGISIQKSGDSVRIINIINSRNLKLNIAVCVTRSSGNLSSTLETVHGMLRFPPRFAFLCGIAGNLRPDRCQLGDVIVPNSIAYRYYNRMSQDEQIEASSDTYRVDAALFARFRTFVEENGDLDLSLGNPHAFEASKHLRRKPEIDHESKIFCWDLVLDCEVTRSKLCRMDNKLRAVEMEAIGFLRSLQLFSDKLGYSISGIIFRGLSDYASKKSQTDFDEKVKWRSFAAWNAATVMVEFIDTLTEEDFARGFDSGQSYTVVN